MVIYPIRWRLLYSDGRILDEKVEGNSILERWSDPETLCLIDIVGNILTGIPIPKGSKPIFYRNRSVGFNGDVQTDAVVFGIGKSGDTLFEGTLWTFKNGKVLNCPEEYLAYGAIELQIS